MNRFYEVMKKHPDEKLLTIVTKQFGEYEPEAVEAAKTVLQERNIDFEIPPEEKTKTLSLEEIRGEIHTRLEAGEKIEQIKSDLKARGVNAFEYAEQDMDEAEKSDPKLASDRKYYGGVAAVCAAVIYFCARYGAGRPVFIYIMLAAVVIGFAMVFFKRRAK